MGGLRWEENSDGGDGMGFELWKGKGRAAASLFVPLQWESFLATTLALSLWCVVSRSLKGASLSVVASSGDGLLLRGTLGRPTGRKG